MNSRKWKVFFLVSLFFFVLSNLGITKSTTDCKTIHQIFKDLKGQWRLDEVKAETFSYLTVKEEKNRRYSIELVSKSKESNGRSGRTFKKNVDLCREFTVTKSRHTIYNVPIDTYTITTKRNCLWEIKKGKERYQEKGILSIDIAYIKGKYVWCWFNTMAEDFINPSKKWSKKIEW